MSETRADQVRLPAEPSDAELRNRDGALRLDAYYYGFDATGILEIDRILAAVAVAGKGYHHTEDWTTDPSDGRLNYVEQMQLWANRAADTIRELRNTVAASAGRAPSDTASVDRSVRIASGEPEIIAIEQRIEAAIRHVAGGHVEGDWKDQAIEAVLDDIAELAVRYHRAALDGHLSRTEPRRREAKGGEA